jgi:hypothetical protein
MARLLGIYSSPNTTTADQLKNYLDGAVVTGKRIGNQSMAIESRVGELLTREVKQQIVNRLCKAVGDNARDLCQKMAALYTD